MEVFITRAEIPKPIRENELNDPTAITKVYDALWRVGLGGTQIVAALNDMDKAGVVFRLQKD